MALLQVRLCPACEVRHHHPHEQQQQLLVWVVSPESRSGSECQRWALGVLPSPREGGRAGAVLADLIQALRADVISA